MSAGSNRREFLTGQALQNAIGAVGESLADAIVTPPPSRGPNLVLRPAAMACDFDIILNPDGPEHQVRAASEALDQVQALEDQYSVYRPDSELSRLNRTAAELSVQVEPGLYRLLRRAAAISGQTDGAFNPAAGALIRLWKQCRAEDRLPTAEECAASVGCCDLAGIEWYDEDCSVRFRRPGLAFDLGAIGKGYAVDVAARILGEQGVSSFLVHGGRSSVLARGGHAGHAGWPVGLNNPLLPDQPYLTLVLKDAAFSTSGTAVQGFRHAGKRYGHILDPRTGWPAEELLSVSVFAPDAALADALSTAFFILGVENALRCCDNFENVGLILFPPPRQGRRLEPVFHNVPDDCVFFAEG
jgi:FAD:protein FMN transferase